MRSALYGRRYVWFAAAAAISILSVLFLSIGSARLNAQGVAPSVIPNNLDVRTVVSGLSSPTTMAFLANNDFLVLEKGTGMVKRVTNGAVAGTVLDLAVNNASERGLLGIALHPSFSTNHFVYLYWTCIGSDSVVETTCADTPQTGADSSNILAVPLLGNRVDRFTWNGSTLAFDRNLIKLRAYQNDATNPAPRGNHDGGVLRFGLDGKLYITFGDNGRRGQLQNLRDGPFGPGVDDDQFGGPEPDDAHLTGVVLRLNDDGSAPDDNPFFALGTVTPGEVGANYKKIFAYGVRNSFGMDIDPYSGDLWDQQNGDDSFDELNRIEAGANLGWVQVMGPAERVAQFKAIETSNAIDPVTNTSYFGLQQERWSPVNIADTPAAALSRLFMLPGAHYSDPEFSWKFAVSPAAIGFLAGRGLGPQYEGDLFVGEARTFLEGGYLFRFKLNGNRRKIVVNDNRLHDAVADNAFKYDITESEDLLFGRNFGVATDIRTGPNGNLFVVSLSNGAVYEIFRTKGSVNE